MRLSPAMAGYPNRAGTHEDEPGGRPPGAATARRSGLPSQRRRRRTGRVRPGGGVGGRGRHRPRLRRRPGQAQGRRVEVVRVEGPDRRQRPGRVGQRLGHLGGRRPGPRPRSGPGLVDREHPPWSSRAAPTRLMRAPESSPASRVSARRLPLATASSRSVTPASASSSSSPVTMRSTSATCSGAVPTPTVDRSGVLVAGPIRPDRVGQAPLLPDLLEEPARQTAAEDVVEHGEGPTALVEAGHRAGAQDQVGLLGRTADHDQRVRGRSTGGSRGGAAPPRGRPKRDSTAAATSRASKSPATETTMLPGR